jgi:hypothetical protein
MRLAVLISLCVLIVAFAVGSILIYENWKKDRYDPLIIEAAYEHDLPPALLKAIIAVRGEFNYYTRGDKGEVGLLQVPSEGIREYKKVVMNNPDYDFGWVCINKAYPPHDRTLVHRLPGVCNICRSPLIRGECYPKRNIEVGAWYLAHLKERSETAIQATDQSVRDVIPLVVAAYCLTEKTVLDGTDGYRNPQLPPRLRDSIEDILEMYRRYKRKGLR